MRAFWLLLLLLPSVSAGDLVVIAHHPYPDDLDPLGVPFVGGQDASRTWHAGIAQGNFAYPFLAVDGRVAISGIPNPEAPYASLRSQVESALGPESSELAPFRILINTTGANWTVTVAGHESLPESGYNLRVAVVEDHVLYAPPPRVSNGVTDHRFVVRAAFEQSTERVDAHDFASVATDGPWYLAAWVVRSDNSDSRYAAGEVLQVGIVPIGEEATFEVQQHLIELRTATWCDPCLFGDQVTEDLFAERGVFEAQSREIHQDGYPIRIRAPIALGVGMFLLLVLAVRK